MGGTGLHIFIVKAGREALSNVLDKEINEPWQQAFLARGVLHRYVPAYDWVAFVFADVARLKPLPPVHGAPGDDNAARDAVADNTAATQLELVIMLPVTDEGVGPSVGESQAPNSSVFYLPFVFNDFVPSIIAGREVYGYPKEYADFTAERRFLTTKRWRARSRPLFGQQPRWHRLTVSAHGPVKQTNSNGKPEYMLVPSPYLSIERGKLGVPTTDVPAPSTQPPRDTEPSGPRAIELLPDSGWIERACHPAPPPAAPAEKVPDEHRTLAELRELLNRQMEYMFLRQFRDPNQTTKASYQAIVMGGIVPNKQPEAKWDTKVDDENYVLHFPELVTGVVKNPIAYSLGIQPIVQADLAVRLENLNITINAATIVWDRS
jgi:hypothetical protein